MTALRDRPRRNVRVRGRAAGKPRSRAFTLAVGFGVVAAAAAMFWVGYDAPNSIPGRSYYVLYARMNNADNLEDHDQVRIGGQLAGQVLAAHIVGHQAQLELQLGSAYRPIRSNSRIEIRLRSAVGIRFVQIDPSTTGYPLRNGAVIPASQTSSPVDLDQVLHTFDPATRAAARDFIGGLGEGLAGQGANVNATIGQAPGVLSSLGSVSAAVNANAQAMRRLITGSQGVAAAFDPVRASLANGFQPESQALQPFVAQRVGLESTLTQAPATETTVTNDLPAVDRLVSQVEGLARAATPTLAVAPAALRQTSALLVDARPGLRGADQTLRLIQRAVTPTLTFLQTAQPVLPQIDGAISDLAPTVSYVAPRSCGLSDAFTGWSEMMKWGNAYNNFIRFTVDETGPIAGSNVAAPLTSPYPGPCVNGIGESGALKQTPEQQVANP